MAKLHFAGFPDYLDRAAEIVGDHEASRLARGLTALGDVSNLCSQATLADPLAVKDILEKAASFRNQLHIAYLAADMMIEALATTETVPSGLDEVPLP